MSETFQHAEKPSSPVLTIRGRDELNRKSPGADADIDHYLRATAAPLARRWIEECISSHDSCQKEARTTSVFCTDNSHYIIDLEGDPSRLLEVTTHDVLSLAAEDRVRIVKPDSSRAHLQYVALSHRWGGDGSLKTTKANYSEMAEKGMRVGELPRTFREAVQLTREMGYSHIWIDSLCIVQDDEEDWKREARRMALIFSKAVCVIEAGDGNGFNSGIVSKDPSPENIGNLSTRAWVLQEQMLPPRSLKFTGGSVLWECRECDASDTHPEMVERGHSFNEAQVPTHPKDIFAFFRDWRLPPNELAQQKESDSDNQTKDFAVAPSTDATQYDTTGKPDPGVSGFYHDKDTDSIVMSYGDDLPGHRAHIMDYMAFNRFSGRRPMRIHPDDDSEPFGSFMQTVTNLRGPEKAYEPFLRVWWQFVSLYTKRRLTYDSDKFLAINGITSVAQRWTHLRSTFGLWFHFLDKEMCWYVDASETPANRPKTWLGPSWSWMSTCNGCIKNDVYTSMPYPGTLLLKPQIRTAMGTSFDMPLPLKAWGQTKYRSIEVKGNLRKATITASKDRDDKPRYDLALTPVGRHSDHEVYDFRPDCAHEFPLGEPISVYCLHVWHYSAKYLDLPQYADVYLVLRQVGKQIEITLQTEWVSEEELLEERTMSRLGYMEVKYGRDEMRNFGDIHEDMWWWWIRLV